jgi:hypothetical protein
VKARIRRTDVVVFGAESGLEALEDGVLGEGPGQVNEVIQGRAAQAPDDGLLRADRGLTLDR